jgi:hypothetical protein
MSDSAVIVPTEGLIVDAANPYCLFQRKPSLRSLHQNSGNSSPTLIRSDPIAASRNFIAPVCDTTHLPTPLHASPLPAPSLARVGQL